MVSSPFIAIDEEGGAVSRTGTHPDLGVPRMESQRKRAVALGEAEIREEYRNLGASLAALGINLNFAPVADIGTGGVIGDRSFSDDPPTVTRYVQAGVAGLKEGGILSVIKHLPGHGSTVDDPHIGISTSPKTLDELRAADLKPFVTGIENGVDGLMSGHIVFSAIEDAPVTFSPRFITDLLRVELDYDGLVFSDALNMGAVSAHYGSSTAACKAAIAAGVDVLVLPARPDQVLSDLADSVRNGEISRSRIEVSVRRIISKKIEAGLIQAVEYTTRQAESAALE
jgi:beta-N-acetylhexosaminidase